MSQERFDAIVIGAGVAGLTCANYLVPAPVKDLYLAGHYSVWPGGIVFSALSGKLVFDGMYEGFAKALLW